MGATGVDPDEGQGDASARLKPEMASRRLLVLAFVRQYIERWKRSPSYGEIAAGVGVGRARAHQLVRRLVADGQLLRTPGPRGLSLPDKRDEAIRQLRELGWSVDEDVETVRRPYTHSKLLDLPPLTYPYRKKSEAGSGRDGKDQGGARARKGNERSPRKGA